MNILLIRVIDSNISRIITFPIGIMYLAGYIEQHIPQVKIKILDTQLCDDPKAEIDNLTNNWIPNIIGLSAMSVDKAALHSLIRLIRPCFLNAKIIVGGSYASAEPENVLSDELIDYCIVGEGEEPFYFLLSELLQGKDIAEDRRLFSKERLVNKGQPLFVPVDKLSYPAYHLVNVEKYFAARPKEVHFPFFLKKRVMPIMFSRGCPYHCSFCHNIFGKEIRYRNIDRIIGELAMLRSSYHAQEILVLDDCFNANLKVAKEIMREIIKKNFGLLFNFAVGIRADQVDAELARLLLKAGTYHVALGIESGSEKIQEAIGKNLSLKRAKQSINLLATERIATTGFFMLGFPDETREDVFKTIQFARESLLTFADSSFVVPFPGTRMYNELAAKKEIENLEISKYISNPFVRLHINLSNMSNQELIKLKMTFAIKFHLSIRRLIIMIKTLGLFKLGKIVAHYYQLIFRYIFKYGY
ncbi:MAG: radical SAM protein [Candidatus Omnitrophota bacterium]|nr:radical SAM protein [Candidatus Omnitrophota bacterium]